ncbi:UPF0668 protein C10orf76 homolog [Copidosoma floridanum]|uniref:UPF0668 protein C10orf76 homolog n=1 Tax=Copidosoma floridanum TaxID=29053 RepID=UPI0006C9B01B|nr:UPF0668 protein C10orf76 homolog [Copidosoma floridanum]XP_014212016.1 UPF0668 protein C10orf76 homolog [Copidosoma floridanum]XP_014212017.1 UPF0668 protein C10orf76 homolog [Copidosoma floridanum]
MATRKRSESGAKRQYRGKFYTMYESLFRGEELTVSNPNYWNELFLIKPIVSHIDSEILKLNEEMFCQCKRNLNLLVSHCIDALGDENAYRIVYSMQTLSAVLFALYKKANQNDKSFDFIDVTFGDENVEERMTVFIQHSNIFLNGEYSATLKSMYLKLFLIIATGLDNINQNMLLDFVMSSSVFESLIQLLRETAARNEHGYNVVLILTLLVNYRKHESANPFIVKLSILDDELALNGYGQVISSSLSTFCRQFDQLKPDVQVSWLSSLTNMIGNIFVGEEEAKSQQIRENNALLLALYEATHLNRNFVTTLAYTQSDTSSPPSPNNTLNANQKLLGFQAPDVTTQPVNLLAVFFQYCSIVIQATKTEKVIHNVKLCFLIMSCISEDQYANSLMHDANLAFRVQLHKMPMHHRKSNNKIVSAQPLAATLLDLLVEFITSHMMKKFPLELYHHCIGILLRILCYQKRCRVRLSYQWINLWTVLINLLKFLSSHESYFVKKMDIFSLSTKVVNILNIFVTYGDMFLSSYNTYDELFYEIIRMKLIFINLNTMGIRYSTNESYEYKESALKLTNSLVNIRDILNHFSPKISEWLAKENISTPSEQQIMDVINENYNSLTLKLLDNLDQFERYSENPKHFEFFSSLVRSIISTTRTSIDINTLDVETILKEYCNSS